ncbi:hypothetical protein BT67DRAFT_444708 [Trichocladium antarcticum]|uniref:Uncharacterized protein n=1 Tax=Trichocladium antarcticum TaxID=1450529 RepID=A0AAN6UF45_9PEZI|nr:hypothetical protein BT67DRAFT_444708 [Trichocladium antarcticum]
MPIPQLGAAVILSLSEPAKPHFDSAATAIKKERKPAETASQRRSHRTNKVRLRPDRSCLRDHSNTPPYQAAIFEIPDVASWRRL